jgi:small subunit ribosomal protein S1
MTEKEKDATLENELESVNNEVEQTEVNEVEFKAESVEEEKEVNEPQAEPVAEVTPEVVAEEVKPAAKEKSTAKKASAPSAKPAGNVGFDDFDWSVINNKHDNYKPEDRKKFSDLYNETLSTVAENECIDGTVISMNKREVVINIGYKSEGVVSLNEFRYNPELKPGDVVEIYVESKEDRKGQLLLSHKKARAMRSWDRVNSALEQDEIIKGYIKCRTKGGMIVDVFGIEAFLPGSQIDVKPIRDYDAFVGKTMEFKVVKINHEFKNVVVSHKALIEAELEQQKKEIIAKLEKGQVLEGTVKNITSYGVFIDLGWR